VARDLRFASIFADYLRTLNLENAPSRRGSWRGVRDPSNPRSGGTDSVPLRRYAPCAASSLAILPPNLDSLPAKEKTRHRRNRDDGGSPYSHTPRCDLFLGERCDITTLCHFVNANLCEEQGTSQGYSDPADRQGRPFAVHDEALWKLASNDRRRLDRRRCPSPATTFHTFYIENFRRVGKKGSWQFYRGIRRGFDNCLK